METVSPFLLSPEKTGIYESLRVYGGKIFRLEEHLDRFFESAKTVGLEILETRAEIRRRIEKTLLNSKQKEAFLRLTWVGAPPPFDHELFIIVTKRSHPPEIYKKGVQLKTATVRRNASHQTFPEAKSTACLNQVLATLEPSPPGNYETLFLNSDGYLTEARIGNLFIVKAEVGATHASPLLLTPPAHGLLNGVTRRFVIECARLGRIPVEENPLMRHDLFNADEAFLTNTSWEILPIREVDGRTIGAEIPGPVTKRLQILFQKGIQREIQNQKETRN